MAWTKSDISTLESAIAKGVRRVTFADQTIEFQDLQAMRDLLAEMRRKVNSEATYRLAATSKGTG